MPPPLTYSQPSLKIGAKEDSLIAIGDAGICGNRGEDVPDLHQWLTVLYQGLPNHNYGWWLTTREHPDVATLVTAAQFVYGRFGERSGSLDADDYNDLQRALGRSVPAGGARTVLNRHLLLNMWRPLRLLERVRSRGINPFRLTDQGLELAQTTEPRRVLESILREVRFVHEDWTRPQVMASYTGISVHPYQVLSAVLEGTDGYLERHEYRLFVSRMRRDDQNSISEAIELVRDFRTRTQGTREALIALEAPVFPVPKSYQNWVDMDLHTFSLFALGTQFRRNDTVLVLAGTAVDATVANAFVFPQGSSTVETAVPDSLRRSSRRQVALRMPAANPLLDIPPPPSIEVNSGQEAEGFVRRLLEANGFDVRDFSRLRGYGFDLWARHPTTGSVYYCEVKSSTGTLGSVEFTRLEVEAAEKYGERYVVFCVEHFDSSRSNGEVWTVQDPWRDLPSVQTPNTTINYSAPRSEWLTVAKRLE